jgi:(S)-2-hydroxyglutarate dehydrogenase
MKENCDFLIVGAGIIGLTVARELRKRHSKSKIIVIEKESEIGLHASGRNSGVLHSGIYYGGDTLKAKMCASGAKRMRDFANEYNIPCIKTGKVITANSEGDLPIINSLMQNSRDNNINAKLLNEDEIREIEPHATPYKLGIYSPDTAVIDSIVVIKRLYMLLLDQGVEFKFNSRVIKQDAGRKSVTTCASEFSYGFLYNCAGAYADQVAKLFGRGEDYTMIPFKGIYYKLRPERSNFINGSIYPVPDIKLPFLGVHITKVINGDVYVGPTAIPALGRENYGFFQGLKLKEGVGIGSELIKMYLNNNNNFRLLSHTEVAKYFKPWFLRSAQKLVSDLTYKDLIPSNKVGIRPQLVNIKTKSLEMDYILEREENSIHVLNSISPAFTSSLAFSEYIVDRSQ